MVWIAMSFVVGLVIAVSAKQALLLRTTSGLLLFFLGFISLYSLDTYRMIGREAPKPIVILLPLFACADAQNYWPGGADLAGASIHTLRSVRNDPKCFLSNTASIALLLLSWAAVAGGFGTVISPVLGMVPGVRSLGKLARHIREWFNLT